MKWRSKRDGVQISVFVFACCRAPNWLEVEERLFESAVNVYYYYRPKWPTVLSKLLVFCSPVCCF